MAASPTIALVAKPWRGGLARYLRATLEAEFPGRVAWIPLYPDTPGERIRYRRDRAGWRKRLAEHIEARRDTAVVFVNLLPEFASLRRRDGLVLWLTDSGEAASAGVEPFPRIFVSDPGYLAEVRKRAPTNSDVAVLPFAFDPTIHAPSRADRAPRHRLCFIANSDPKRDRHLAPLLAGGPPVDVYGNYHLRHRLYWRHPTRFRRPVPNEVMARVYRGYAASLNIHADVVREGTNMRTFECAGYGIAQLVEYRPELERYFDLEDEVAIYHGPDDIRDCALRLLADPARRERLAARARDRALAEHTYRDRVGQMLRGIVDLPTSRGR